MRLNEDVLGEETATAAKNFKFVQIRTRILTFSKFSQSL